MKKVYTREHLISEIQQEEKAVFGFSHDDLSAQQKRSWNAKALLAYSRSLCVQPSKFIDNVEWVLN